MRAPFANNALTFSDVVKPCVRLSKPSVIGERGKIATIAGLSEFSVFFMQPPFLDFQRTMQEKQCANAVRCIPTDNYIRNLLDAGDPAVVYPLFDVIFDGFQRADVIDAFRTADQLLLALDGTDYFFITKASQPLLFE